MLNSMKPSSHSTPPLIGLTGGIASGKSTVSTLLQERGARIVDADLISRQVVLPGSLGLKSLTEEWGNQILTAEGSLNRTVLGSLIFENPLARQRLNSILHPLIAQESARQIQDAFKEAIHSTLPLIVYDAALLIESGRADQFRPLIVVSTPESKQIERIQKRDGLSFDEAQARVHAQFPLDQKRAVADFIIKNHLDLDHVHQEVDRLWKWLGLRSLEKE